MLDQLIEKTRLQMLEEAKFYGFTSDKTVQTSQALDHLLNCFQQKYIFQTNRPSEYYQVHGSFIKNIKNGLQHNRLSYNKKELLEKDPTGKWYSLKEIHKLLLDLEKEFDEGVIRDIGKFVPTNSIFPTNVDSFEKGLLNLNLAYKLNHSDNMEGYYAVFFQNRKEIYVICNTRFYSSAFNEGILIGLSEKFNVPARITQLKKDKGGEFKIDLLSAV